MTALTSNPQPRSTSPMAMSSQDPTQYLTFMLAGEVFALGILAVKEIIEYHSLTAVSYTHLTLPTKA